MSCNSSSPTEAKCEKSKRRCDGIDQRARLLDVLAQHLAQRGVQQVRAGVVAHGGAADFVVDHGVNFVADVDGLLSHDAMRAHALHGIGHALDLGDERVVIVGVEPADIAHLSAGLGVKGRVVEHDLAALAGPQLLRANSGSVVRLDDGQHFASGGERLAIAFELGAGQGLISGLAVAFEPPFQEACARVRCSSMAASKPACIEHDSSDRVQASSMKSRGSRRCRRA